MDKPQLSFASVTLKTIVIHSVTYLLVGWLAFTTLDYASLLTGANPVMRPISDPIVRAGVVFQPIRGALFGIVFYLLREPLFGKKNGGLVLWLTLVVLGILGTFGPTPGSLEGIIFTKQPLLGHLFSLPEILLQSLLLSMILFYWVNHPEMQWLNWIMGIAFILTIGLPLLGLAVNP